VAVLDTGVDATHPDLSGIVRVGPDYTDGERGVDLNGHGTNVAGIIAARAGNGIGIAGAAAGVRILSLRVLDAQASGDTRQVAAAIDAAVAAGAQVINLSLSPGTALARTLDTTDPIVPAMQRAVAAGVVLVAAAGNFALPLCAQPLAVTGILCVGAVNRSLGLTDYTDFGVRVDVVAPGGDDRDPILSTAPGGGYAAMAGTSQAAPQVAALAALLVARGLDSRTVIARIEQTTRDLGVPGEDPQFGHGLIDMSAALGTLPPPPVAEHGPRTASTTGSASVTLTTPATFRARRLLRSGAIVSCRTTLSGFCRVEMRAASILIARGRRLVAPRTATNVRVRLTARGRTIVRQAAGLRAVIRVRGPHGASARTTVRIDR
jgi:subtilisin family serine protease